MKKVDGLYLAKDEVFILQKLLAYLLKTENPNEAAKETAKLKDEAGYKFTGTDAGMTVLEFMRFNTMP